MPFAGFPRDTLTLLERINANNTKEWFTANRPLYNATIEASKAFVEAVGPELRKFAPAIQFEPKGWRLWLLDEVTAPREART